MEKKGNYRRPKITDLKAEIETLRQRIMKLEGKYSTLMVECNKAKAQKDEADKKINELNTVISHQRSYIQEANRKHGNAKEALEKVRTELEKVYARTWWQRLMNYIPE